MNSKEKEYKDLLQQAQDILDDYSLGKKGKELKTPRKQL